MIASLILLASLGAMDGIFANGFDGPCFVPSRQWVKRATVSYGTYPKPERINLDVTTWTGLWGYNNTTAPATPWPGVGGASPVLKAFPRDGFLCAKFTTPSNMATRSGKFSNPSYYKGPNVTMKIVDRFGLMPTPGCVAQNVPTSDANLVQWKGTSNNPTGSCNLQPLTDYYVVQYFTDPTACAKQNCIIGSVSYHN